MFKNDVKWKKSRRLWACLACSKLCSDWTRFKRDGQTHSMNNVENSISFFFFFYTNTQGSDSKPYTDTGKRQTVPHVLLLLLLIISLL